MTAGLGFSGRLDEDLAVADLAEDQEIAVLQRGIAGQRGIGEPCPISREGARP
jgi:hypothetical protein